MSPPLGSEYQKMQAKTASYTLLVSDDVVKFTSSGAGVIATLPKAASCPEHQGQSRKIIASASGSTDPITIAVQSGDTLVGATKVAGAAATIEAGQTAVAQSNGSTVWTITGGDGTQGVSGYSGFSGWSGFSGKSGYSGFSGYSGYSGISGYSGWSGYSGKSGYSGVSGYSGYSGVSGYSGFSGYSGYTGV